MAIRSNHYDAAFEEFLRSRCQPYVAVDETRRALLEESSLKSMDFIVYTSEGPNWLVDVKGRRFDGPAGNRWENWATEDDIRSLTQWENVFGPGFEAVLVYAYEVSGPSKHFSECSLFSYRDRLYGFYGIRVAQYREEMKQRSRSWGTVCLAAEKYRSLRFSLVEPTPPRS